MVWLNSVQVYLMVNNEVYNTDEKKIAFTLSFMKKRSAQTWATTFIRDSLNSKEKSFGEFIDFAKKFKEAFIHSGLKGEAIAWLSNTTDSKNLPIGILFAQLGGFSPQNIQR